VSLLGDIASQLRWQDIVDILVLTLVVFRAYTWMRGTTALRIGLGMLLLVGAAFAADELGLLLTAYVLQALGAVATLVVVVIFRDEIRRGLGRVNPLRWWRDRRTPADRSAFAPLARAVFALAQHRIGAILVLPREDSVDGHLTGGTALDALLSIALLEAIFHAKSPIHDGSAVITDGRVRLAGAFLPISTSPDIPDHMGSRHRAALGLTEHCDGVVLVVSEERGRVSVAAQGHFLPTPGDTGALIQCLDRLMGNRTAHAGSEPLRRTGNGLAFLASLALVTTAWYVVVAGPGTAVTRTVAVELRDLPPGLEAEPPRPQEVSVQVHGPRTLLGELGADDVTAWVDLAGAGPGSRRIAVQAEVPSGFRVVKIAPRHVAVRVHRTGSAAE
jgi:diadenylate cyclase